MSDLLRLDYINSFPQPFIATLIGNGGDWELHDIDVETGLLRINACGMLDVKDITDVEYFTDMDGNRHDPDTFYSDYNA